MLRIIQRFVRRRIKKAIARLSEEPVAVYGIEYDIFAPIVTQPYRNLILYERYEPEEISLARKYLDATTPVIELGAGLGVVSCIISKSMSIGNHIAVEANPKLIDNLEYQKRLNDIDFEIIQAAYHPTAGTVEFTIENQFDEGRVSREEGDETISVEAISLNDLVSQLGSPKFNLVSDIEGAEIGLIKNESEILSSMCSYIICETHPNQYQIEDFMRVMERCSFKKVDQEGAVYAFKNQTIT